MIKHWNRTGKIKAIVLTLFCLPNLIAPIGAVGQPGFAMILMPLIFGAVSIPLITKINQRPHVEIKKPEWNDNPLTLKQPLIFYDFLPTSSRHSDSVFCSAQE